MRTATIFIAIVVMLLIFAGAGITYIVMNAGPPIEPRTVVAPIEVEPGTVDLGAVSQCNDLIEVRSTLRNTSQKTFHLNQVITSCGCTVPDVPVPLKLGPGETFEFAVMLDPWSATGVHSQQIDFIYAETGRAPPFRVRYDVQSPIRTIPGAAQRHVEPTLILKVTSEDGSPFLIEGVDPPIVEEWITTPSSETHLTVDWSLVDALAEKHPELFAFGADGRWKRGALTIRLSREDCREIHLRTYNSKPGLTATGPNLGPTAPEP